MRYPGIIVVLALLAPAGRADPVRYEQIPADVMSYSHVDVDALLASRPSQIPFDGQAGLRTKLQSPPLKQTLTGSVRSCTIYSLGAGDQVVLLLHASQQRFRDEFEQPRSRDRVIFQYGTQEVHYSSSCLLPELFGKGNDNGAPGVDVPSQLSIGLGTSQSRFHGAFYTAYVGQDLIVTALDLPAMAEAMDVLSDKKPSLAKEDPRGLKGPIATGVIIVGAGLSAEWAGGNLPEHDAALHDRSGPATRPLKVGGGNFDLDLFGSFRGKARLARFDVGEDEQNDYVHATFTMSDADSAGQLRNLIAGIKAMVSLTQAEERPFIDPLEIAASGKEVNLTWSMPTTKLAELIRNSAGPPTDDRSSGATIPATRPAH